MCHQRKPNIAASAVLDHDATCANRRYRGNLKLASALPSSESTRTDSSGKKISDI